MNTAEKLITIAQNCESIYSNGFNKGFAEGDEIAMDNLYSAITIDGIRTKYSWAFARTNFDMFAFPEPITPTSSIDRMFYYYFGDYLPNIDLSKVPVNADCQALFAYSKLRTIPDLGLPAMNGYLNAFLNCSNLQTISKLRSKQSTEFSSTFSGCSKLKNITFEGTIGQNISFEDCPSLTRTSIVNMFNKLVSYSSGTHTIKLHPTALARLSESDIAIATNKKWAVTSA